MQALAVRMGTGRRVTVEERAARAVEVRARIVAATSRVGETVTRVAVYSPEAPGGYEICSRWFYEEACSELEFICEAYAVQDERGELHSSVEF